MVSIAMQYSWYTDQLWRNHPESFIIKELIQKKYFSLKKNTCLIKNNLFHQNISLYNENKIFYVIPASSDLHSVTSFTWYIYMYYE